MVPLIPQLSSSLLNFSLYFCFGAAGLVLRLGEFASIIFFFLSASCVASSFSLLANGWFAGISTVSNSFA